MLERDGQRGPAEQPFEFVFREFVYVDSWAKRHRRVEDLCAEVVVEWLDLAKFYPVFENGRFVRCSWLLRRLEF